MPEIIEDVARLGAQLLMELEAEVTAFWGRERYQWVALVSDAQPGSAPSVAGKESAVQADLSQR